MQNTNYVLTVCQKIQKMGKKPSVALIRQYSTIPLGIPDIVKALQMWKSNPQIDVKEEASQIAISPSNNLEERVIVLEKQVAELTEKLTSLLGAH